MKKFILIIIILLFVTKISQSQVVINEYSCSNMSSFLDNFGDYEDWIELYNTTGTAVNLNGWHLSDNKLNPVKWTFGNVSIPANGFLRIWASSRDVATGANLHTNFKLTQCDAEAIVLANPMGGIIDSLTLKPTLESHSRGRTTNGAATWGLFTTPNPNASNVSALTDYVARPVMSIAPGFYSTAQSVTITCSTAGATVRYTLDGSTPTASSTLYTGPVSITTTTVVRARAFSTNPALSPSFVESNTYFINSPHTIEVISIFGDQILNLLNGSQIDPYTGLEYFDHTGVLRTESYGKSNKHGNDSWAYQQRGIDFISRDQYGYNDALEHKIFINKSRDEFQRIILKAAANDNYPFEMPGAAHIRDSYVHTLSQRAKLHMDERTWAPSILYVNGQYWGVYDTREKVDDDDFMEYYHDAKPDSLQMLKTWGGTWVEYGGPQAQTDWNNFRNFVTTNNMTIPANYAYVDSVYSIKSLADYVILNSFVVCSDWLNWNTIWYRGLNVDADKKKWRYGLWDEDATFDHYINYTGIPNTNPDADPCDPNSLNNPGGQGHVPILNALLQNQTFYQYYITRYFDLLNGPMSCSVMINLLDSMVNVIQPEMQRHINRWGSGGSFADWQNNVQTLRTFIQNRCNLVMQQFSDCWPTTGPFPLKVNVSPAGSGTVELNSINLTNFVWTGQYPGNMNILMTAKANPTYCFDHWEFQFHTPTPGISDSSISFLFTQADSVIAHFSNGGSPTATATPAIICVGDSSQLGVSGGINVVWSPSTGLSCTNCPDPIANPTVTTTYTATITGGCSPGTATVTVTVNQPGINNPTITSNFTTICLGDTAQLQVSTADTYSWSPATGLSCTDCPNPLANPTTATTYTVTVTGYCTNGSASITINIAPPPVISVSESVTICPQSNIQLYASGAAYYTWSPASGLSCSDCPDPIASPDSTTTYTIIGSNGPGAGCKDTTAMTVFVTDDCPDIYIPTGFSPNGDNNNELYLIFGDLESLELVIYDRWGHEVFKTTDQTQGWDGTYKGKPLPAGVYAFRLSITEWSGNIQKKTGNITLVR